MADSRSIANERLTDLRRFTMTVGLGATQAAPLAWDEVFGATSWKPRDPSTHTYLGITVTHPAPGIHVFGAAYHDARAGHDKEDLFVLDSRRSAMTAYYRGEYERVDERYRGTHHGAKPYLRPSPPSEAD